MSDSGSKCPLCAGEMNRNDKFIRGHIVLRCRPCNLYQLEGDNFHIVADYGMQTAGIVLWLQRRALDLDETKRYAEMLTSDIDDPRWVKVEGLQ